MLNFVWDIWNFQNFLVYDKGGVKDKTLHKDLNNCIDIKFELGDREFLLNDKYLFVNYNHVSLIDSRKEDKQAWLRQIDTAQQAIYNEDPEPVLEAMEQSILDYYNADGNNT